MQKINGEFIMNECKWYPICPIKRFIEQGKVNKYWVRNYCKGDWNNCIRYKMEEQSEEYFLSLSKKIRKSILKIIYRTKSPHIGGSLSCVEILASLYFKVLKVSPEDPANPSPADVFQMRVQKYS